MKKNGKTNTKIWFWKTEVKKDKGGCGSADTSKTYERKLNQN